MADNVLLEYTDIKLAIKQYLSELDISSRYSLYTDGNTLMFSHKDEETNRPNYNLMIWFKEKPNEMRNYNEWLKGYEDRLSYPYDIKYNDKFQLLSEDGISRYNGDRINESVIDMISDKFMKEIYTELSKEIDKGYLLEHGLASFS